MAQPNTVEIVKVFRVAPDPLPAASPKSLPLTFFDLMFLRVPPPQRLFFYQVPTPNTSSSITTTSFFFDSILPKLKNSLSLTLHRFLPLVGSLTWPQTSPVPVVVYDKETDAVSLTVAQSNADFHHLSDDQLSAATELHPLVPNLAASHERASVLAIQITLFPNHSGFSIGIAMHHAVLDGKTLSLFMKSWAHTCQSLIGDHDDHVVMPCMEPYKPSYERTRLMEDPAMANLGAIFSNDWLRLDGPDNRSLLPWEVKVKPDSVRGTFQLPRAQIEKLRLLNNVVASTFCVACAYTWVCLVKSEEERQQNDIKTSVAFPVDCRSRLDPPLPTTYFGNCITGRHVVALEKELLEEEGFVVAVKAIREAIKSLEIKGQLLNGAENLVSWMTRDMYSPTTHVAVARRRVYTIVASPRFEFYGTDFGWGRPRKVDVVTTDRTGGISVSDSRNSGDGGVEIGLVLEKHHMEVFASIFTQGLESL